MIGRPHWFKRRKYGGWGFYPSCWQGWVYVAVLLASFGLVQLIPGTYGDLRLWVLVAWSVVFAADALHIFIAMPKDERETAHEAKAERNAMWAMVLVLCVGMAFEVASGMVRGVEEIDPVIIAALAAGLIAKAGTNVYLDSRE